MRAAGGVTIAVKQTSRTNKKHLHGVNRAGA